MTGNDKLPVMPLWVSDFLGSSRVQEMSGLARGVYLTLLVHEWDRKATGLPSSTRSICRLLNITSREWRKVKGEVLQFFVEKDGKLYNPRLEKVLQETLKTKEQYSERAKKANEVRWKRSL